MSLVAAVVALAGFGIVWLNVRNQHPFTGPSPASLVFFYALIALRIATVIYAYARARTGISGRSVKVQRDEAVAMIGVLLVCYLALIGIANSGSHGAGFYWSLGLNGTLIALPPSGRALRDPQALARSRARRCGRADRCPRRNCRPPRHVARQRCGALRAAAGERGDRHVAAARDSDTHGADGRMTAEALDPLIHVPARLQIMAALATLPNGDQLSFKRLQDMIELTPGNLITHLRKLEEAGYLRPAKRAADRPRGPRSR